MSLLVRLDSLFVPGIVLRPPNQAAGAVRDFGIDNVVTSGHVALPSAFFTCRALPPFQHYRGLVRRNWSSQLSVAQSARFAVTSILAVCSIPSSVALTVEPSSVSHCDVHVLVARPP